MPLYANECPADLEEVAEAYYMDALDAADAAAFEEHLMVCDECLHIVEATEKYVRSLRESLERIQTEPDAR
jgi:hypothetical protein